MGKDTLGEAWDLKNFSQLKEITIEFAMSIMYHGNINLAAVLTQARSWCFQVGGNRVLNLDIHHPNSRGFVPGSQPTACTL
jgi:hypothetical protein